MPTRCCFLYIKVLNVLFTTVLAEIYLVVTIKICLEFPKMDQSTDKNKLQQSHSAHAHDHDLRTVLALELFEAACNSRNNDRQ